MSESVNKLTEKFLFYIKKYASEKPLSITALKNKFNLTDRQLASIFSNIESWGYKFGLSANQISYISAPDTLIDTEIKFGLKTKFIGQAVKTYQSVKSTNDIASSIAESTQSEGTIVTAEQQTKGKGRLGRSWHSPLKVGIYLSIILKPKFEPESAPAISVMTAFALAETLKEFTDARIQIKWPNDVMLNGKKTAGILTELSAEKNIINYLVVGVGINVNQTVDDFPVELKEIATSIRRVNRKKTNRVKLLQKFLVKFEKEYLKYSENKYLSSLKKINEYSSLTGEKIELASGKRIIKGTVSNIDKSGALILDSDGKQVIVSSGEVTVIK
jgi:BirA family biotin operon repressor/biotin-[acetyl-CoA-carboxylase] ligase